MGADAIEGVCPIHDKSVLMCSCRFTKLSLRLKELEHRRGIGQDVVKEIRELQMAAAFIGLRLKQVTS